MITRLTPLVPPDDETRWHRVENCLACRGYHAMVLVRQKALKLSYECPTTTSRVVLHLDNWDFTMQCDVRNVQEARW